jgi:uncharacterized protein YfaQ (DUF2300 family)
MGDDGGEMKGSLAALLLAAVSVAAMARPASVPTATLVWLDDGTPVVAQGGVIVNTEPRELRTPLGSVWKLFVYSYIVEQGLDAPAYRCPTDVRRDDEVYCCEPGEAVERDAALARSCGPFFEPQRLQIDAARWRAFWQQAGSPDWLTTLPDMQPATTVAVMDLLKALRQVPPAARVAARRALLPNTTRDPAVLAALGSGPRFKTWSWTNAQGQRIGGAAGWLADASPFWVGGPGSSRQLLTTQAATMAKAWLPSKRLALWPDNASLEDEPCVTVNMFARYPLRAVLHNGNGGRQVPTAEGPLLGTQQLQFVNGQSLRVQGTSQLQMRHRDGVPHIEARLSLEDYVARVIDREGDARESAASRALAVAARSWLMHNTTERSGCRVVDDSSQAQRVSPNPATPAARAAAAFTQGLVLTGADVRFHRDAASPGVMAWSQAVHSSRQGRGFVAIVQQAYPQAAWSGVAGQADCEALPQAQGWLREREQRWRERLRREAGFEPASAQLQVCRLSLGVPHADAGRMQIRIREWISREGRVTLVHEYLHLAFRHHTRGADERYIERLAQQLVDL